MVDKLLSMSIIYVYIILTSVMLRYLRVCKTDVSDIYVVIYNIKMISHYMHCFGVFEFIYSQVVSKYR